VKEIEREAVTLQGQKFYAHEWIPDEVRGTVVLVHGLGEHVCRYKHVARELNEAGFALFGFDLPGHGHTGGPQGHIPSFQHVSEMISSMLDKAAEAYPNQPHFLYGHSLGGALVLYHMITQKPDLNGVISTSPALGTAEPTPAWKVILGKVLYKLYPAFPMENGLDVTALSHIPEVVKAYQIDPLVHSKVSVRLGLDVLQNGPWIIEHAADFPDIPLLLMAGSKDRIVSPDRVNELAKKFKNGNLTFKMWDGLYHELHNEVEQTMVIKFMVDWLLKHSEPDSRP
jgi:alpha-beta hydrolase superfamily lysophospholipase